MPQITYIPASDRNDELTGRAFERLFSNIDDNIRNRRAQEARKSSRAELAAQQMAAGLRPKANITYTDEGMKFDSPEARKAYYEALGSKIGASDMSRDGGTETTSQVVGGEDHMKAVAAADTPERQARRARMDAAEVDQLNRIQNIEGNNPTLIRSDGSPNPASTVVPDKAASIGAMQQMLGLTQKTAASMHQMLSSAQQQQNPSAATVPAAQAFTHLGKGNIPGVGPKGLPVPNVNVPAPPPETPQAKTKTTTTAKAGGKESTSVSLREHDAADITMTEGDINIRTPEYIQQTKTVKTGRLDDVKTSFWDLMGMKAAEDDAMSAYRLQNPQAASLEKGTFETALAKRQADMQRWEAASTQDGTQMTTDKGGEKVYEVKGGTTKLGVTAKNALANNYMNTVNVGGSTTNLNPGNNPNAKNAVYKYMGTEKEQEVETSPTGILLRDAGDLTFRKGPFKPVSGGDFQTKLADWVKRSPSFGNNKADASGWKVESDNPTGNPGQIWLRNPASGEEIAFMWNDSKKDWQVTAKAGTNVSRLQSLLGNTFTRNN